MGYFSSLKNQFRFLLCANRAGSSVAGYAMVAVHWSLLNYQWKNYLRLQ